MSDYNLMRSVLTSNGPTLASDYLALVRSSDDPEQYRKALELIQKVNQRDESNSGVVVNVTFDMNGGALSASTTQLAHPAEVIELPAPGADDDEFVPATIDLSELLGP